MRLAQATEPQDKGPESPTDKSNRIRQEIKALLEFDEGKKIIGVQERIDQILADSRRRKEEEKAAELRKQIERQAEEDGALRSDEDRQRFVDEKVDEAIKEKQKSGEFAPTAEEEKAATAKAEEEAERQKEARALAEAEAQAQAKARAEAERALAPEVSGPSAFEQEVERQKERAFESYEREKARGDLRDLLDTVE